MAGEGQGHKRTAMAEGVSFYLDRESHKKFLRVATNQELEAENTRLKAENERMVGEIEFHYQEKYRPRESWDGQSTI